MPVVMNGNYNKQLNTACKLQGPRGYSGATTDGATTVLSIIHATNKCPKDIDVKFVSASAPFTHA
jgi:hypothetical protein